MPPRIAALPRDRNGVPVTWAACWTSELSVQVRPEPLLDGVPAYFSPEAPGQGESRISLPHPSRVRRCVLADICQVCGGQLGEGPRWVCDIRLGEDHFRYGKRMVPLLIDAWTCASCIEYSLMACPNLGRRPTLDVLLVSDWLHVPSLERPKWIPMDVTYGPIGFVKIAALDYRIFSTEPNQGRIEIPAGEGADVKLSDFSPLLKTTT